MHLVAVYGSLKKGFGNHGLLADSEMVATGQTEPKFTMLSLGGFPAIVIGGKTAIRYELYSVSDHTLHLLDMLEGAPHFYHRENINTEHGESIIYVLTDNDRDRHRYPIVENGMWLNPRAREYA